MSSKVSSHDLQKNWSRIIYKQVVPFQPLLLKTSILPKQNYLMNTKN
jgi:hypothetical protein